MRLGRPTEPKAPNRIIMRNPECLSKVLRQPPDLRIPEDYAVLNKANTEAQEVNCKLCNENSRAEVKEYREGYGKKIPFLDPIRRLFLIGTGAVQPPDI